MRHIVNTLLGNVVESFFGRLEEGITVEKHILLVSRLLGEIRKLNATMQRDSPILAEALQSVISSISAKRPGKLFSGQTGDDALRGRLSVSALIDPTKLEESVSADRFESIREVQLIQLAGLIDASYIGEDRGSGLDSTLRDLLGSASWSGSEGEIAVSRIIFGVVFCGLKRGFVSPEKVVDILSWVVENLPAKDWFSSAGTLYGTSYVLRSVLAFCSMKHHEAFMDYIQDVGERLMRHLEVKRQKALQFRMESVPDDALYLLERTRFTIGLLDAAELFQDVRYLNIALKANDWHYKDVHRVKLSSKLTSKNLVRLMVALHYASSIAQQERIWRIFFEDEGCNTRSH